MHPSASDPTPSDVFAARLRTVREQLGVSQVELAKRISALQGTELQSTAVTRIEQQTRAVRLEEAVYAAQALGVPLMLLVTENPTVVMDAEVKDLLRQLSDVEQQIEAHQVRKSEITRSILDLQRQRNAITTTQNHLNTDPR